MTRTQDKLRSMNDAQVLTHRNEAMTKASNLKAQIASFELTIDTAEGLDKKAMLLAHHLLQVRLANKELARRAD